MSLTIFMQNWMSHKDVELQISAPVALIMGKNGSGKTAIRDAMEFAFLGTGKLRGIAHKKDLAQLSITKGQSKCRVTVTMPLLCIRREMTRDSTQTIERMSRPDIGSDWPAWKRHPVGEPLFDDGEDVIRVVLEPTAFWTMDPRKRREMLIQATTEAGETEATILEALRDYLQPENSDDEDALLGMAKLAAADGFRAAEEQAGEERRVAKRGLKELDLTEPDFSHIAPDRLTGFKQYSLDQYLDRLRGLRESHTAAVLAEGISTTAIEGRLQEAVAALERLDAYEGEAADKDAAKDAAAAVDAHQAGVKALSSASDDVKTVMGEIERLSQIPLGGGDFEKPKQCPAVPFEMKCPVKKSTFDNHRPEIAPGYTLDGLLESQKEQLETAKDVEVQARAAVSDLESEESLAVLHAQEEIERKAREDAHMERIVEARARKEEIEGELLEARKQSEKPAGDESAARLQERIDKGEEVIQLRREWAIAKEKHEAHVNAQSRLETEKTRWDEIAKALKPDGVETKLGGGAREAFMQALEQTQGLAGQIHLDDEFELSATIHGQTFHSLQLSTSQRLALGMAIQHAMAMLIEFPFLIVDAIDLFDPDQRAAFAAFAEQVAPQYPAAVVGLVTLGSKKPVAPRAGFESFVLTRNEPIDHLKQ